MAKDGYGEWAVSMLGVHLTQKTKNKSQYPVLRFALIVLSSSLTGLNGGYDDVHKDYKVFDIEPIQTKFLNSNQLCLTSKISDWLTDTYVDALNIIHYMTESVQLRSCSMAFLPTKQRANMIRYSWFANTVDTLSAIKYATVKPIRDENGYIYDYEIPSPSSSSVMSSPWCVVSKISLQRRRSYCITFDNHIAT